MSRKCLAILLALVASSAAAQEPPSAEPPAPPETAAEPEPPPPAEAAPPAEPPPPAEALGDAGKVVGTVIDAKSGEPMIEAQVTIVQTGKKILTDLDGKYEVKLPPGTYDVRVWAELRPARRISKVVVEKGKTTTIDVALGAGDDEANISVQEVVVVAAPDTTTEAVQIVRRQKASTVSDAISAEQISRTPDSSAGDAVKRVVAATVQEGKYIVVRGLGGRYSSTLLNGVSLPSPDPDNPAAPLDLFPASLLANLTVNKTFSPDIPGNFAGGSMNIETREFPTRFTLKLRTSISGDTATTFRDAATTGKGGSLDFLGYDDGARAMPSSVPNQRVSATGDGAIPADQLTSIARSFPNQWTIGHQQAIPNVGFGATVGDTLTRAGARFGYLGTLSYGHKWTRRDQETRTVRDENTARREYTGDIGIESANLGGLVNLGFAPAPTQRFGLIALYSHSSDDNAQLVEGVTETERFGRRSRLRFVERGLGFGQLSGEHALAGSRLTLAWQANLAVTTQSEPDVRDLNYLQIDDGSGAFQFDSTPGSGERYYVELDDVSGGGSVDLNIPLQPLKIKVGGAVNITSRDLAARRFLFGRPPGVDANDPAYLLPPDQLFAPENMGTLLRVQEATRSGDGYDFSRKVYAGYAMLDVSALDPLRLVGGARLEVADQTIEDSTKYVLSPGAPPANRDDLHVLPALNAIYSIGGNQNVRASYSMTVARPHIRELAPFRFVDYARSRVLEGNPDLTTTTIHNGDLRYERFLGATALVAASVFYKRFSDPIEAVIGAQEDVTYRNTESAESFGGELEARLALPANLRVAANLTLIKSSVTFNEEQAAAQTSKERPLQGQSPYVANLEVGYAIPSTKSDFTVLYNVFGKRISEAGVNMTPDTYEQPFHRVDVTYSQKLPQELALKVSATNVLNQRVKFQQGSVEVLGYDPGVGFSAALEWSY